MKRYFARIVVAIIFVATALPLAAESIRFAVVADTQGQGDNAVSEKGFSKIVKLVLEADPKVQFVVQVGDLVKGTQDGDQLIADFQLWREIAKPWYESDFLGLKVYLTPGNHDQYNAANCMQGWQEVFPELPDNGPENQKKMTYSFDFGECHFVVVNTSSPTAENHTVNTDWLSEDLANSDKPVTFVFGHEPAYPMGKNIAASLDAKPDERDRFWQIMADNGVQAYFCGHEHVYDHWIKDGVHQIISGSGGVQSNFFDSIHYLIVDVDEKNEVTVSVYNANINRLIERYSLADTRHVAHEKRPGLRDLIYPLADDLPCIWIILIPACLLALGFTGLTSDGKDL
jgi:3',5'-cyclic AMP phosphodiesterase CpdA